MTPKQELRQSILSMVLEYASAERRYTIAAMRHPGGMNAFYDNHDLTASYREETANTFQLIADALEAHLPEPAKKRSRKTAQEEK